MTKPILPIDQNTLTASVALSEKIERVLIKGDLSALTEEERSTYYLKVCESVGLNPLTKPFDYLTLNQKLVLYATKACTDQLRFVHKISIEIVSREKVGEVYVVTARAKDPHGRTDESTGVVAPGKAFGDNLANLYMKAETKAKRRVTLSICGLGLLDESEVDSIPGVQRTNSEIDKKPAAQLSLSPSISIDEQLIEDFLEEAENQSEIPPADRVIRYGKKYAGKKFGEFSPEQIRGYVEWMRSEGKDKTEVGRQFIADAEAYIKAADIPF